MDRRAFIKSVFALAIAKVSAARASSAHLSLPIATSNPLPKAKFPSSSVPEYNFHGQAIIKVVGIGGAGSNAIDYARKEGVRGVEFIAANTDAQALTRSIAPSKILFGETGLGTGANPEAGRIAAEGHREDIRALLDGAHIAFLTAGMGGGTGTGAAPVVAEIAKEMGLLTIGVVTKPFSFENDDRLKAADAGITEMEKHVDSLIVIPNDNLLDVMCEASTLEEGFKAVNDVLKNAVCCVADVINQVGLGAPNFEAVRTLMSKAGYAKLGYATAVGTDRSRIAAEQAVTAPLLEGLNLATAKGVLINITAAKSNLKRKEVYEVIKTVKTFANDDVPIICGAVYDEQMGDVLRVTMVVTGIA